MVVNSEVDMISTSLVMMKEVNGDWQMMMAEPLVVSAGLNYLMKTGKSELMKYFSRQLFEPVLAPNPTPSDRGNMMELVVVLRFLQGWWADEEVDVLSGKIFPSWFDPKKLEKPKGVVDCRYSEFQSAFMFRQQLLNACFPYVLLPSTKAGPDVRYSVFICNIKTTWTSSSNSSMYVNARACGENQIQWNGTFLMQTFIQI
jgi:hypothetical protein